MKPSAFAFEGFQEQADGSASSEETTQRFGWKDPFSGAISLCISIVVRLTEIETSILEVFSVCALLDPDTQRK